MKKHSADANKKLKAELARARLERLVRIKKPRQAPAPAEPSEAAIDRLFERLR